MSGKRVDQDPSSKRQSVTLTAADLADLAMIRNSPEARRAIGATDDNMSESSLLHTLLVHSLRQAREAAEEAAYATLAEDPEEVAIETALRSQRRSRRRPGGEA